MRLCAVLRRTCAHELRLSRCLSSETPVRPDGPVRRSWAPNNNVRTPRANDKHAGDTASRGQYNGDGRAIIRSQYELKGVIDKIFADRNVCDEVMFTNFVKDGLHECSASNVARFSRLSGKKSRSKSNMLLKAHLPEVASRIRALSSSSWSFSDISFVIYGLQSLQVRDPGYLDIISAMIIIANATLNSKETLSAQGLSMMLYGLQKSKCNDEESQKLLKKVTQMVSKCVESLSAQAVGNALYGLQGMSSDSVEVRALVLSLASKVDGCKESLSAQAVGNALYGLQGMSSDSVEVRALVSSLVSKVDGCEESLNAQAVGNALYGLRGMSSDSAEVRALVLSLVSKVDGCKESLDAQAVGNALYGLQGMSSDSVEVRALVSSLGSKVDGCEESLNAQAVGNAL